MHPAGSQRLADNKRFAARNTKVLSQSGVDVVDTFAKRL